MMSGFNNEVCSLWNMSGIGPKVDEYYRNYVNSANIKTVYNIAAEHCLVSAWSLMNATCKFMVF